MADLRIELPGGYVEYRFGHGDICEITDIAVGSESRRTGIGHRLVDKLIQQVKRTNKANTIYAITRANNMVAQQFYEKLRFHGSPLRNFYDAGASCVDAILYSRSVHGPV